MSVPAGMMEPASLRHLLPERLCVLAGEGGLGKEVRAVSKPKGRRAHVRKGKVTARKVSVGCVVFLGLGEFFFP